MRKINKIVNFIFYLINFFTKRSGNNKEIVLTNNVDLDKKKEIDILNRKLTSEIESFKEIIKSRDEEVKVLLGMIDKYKLMEENLKKSLEPNKKLVDRLEEEEQKLAEIRSNVYGNIMQFEKVKFNKDENLMGVFDNKNNINKNEDSRNSSFSNANSKTTNANSNMNALNSNINNTLLNSITTNSASQVNNFFNNANSKINTSNNNSTNNSNSNNKSTNYNPVPISLLKEINTVNTYTHQNIKLTKDIILNELKMYEIFKNNYIRFSSQEEENRKNILKEKFEQGRVLAQEYTNYKKMSDSIKTSVHINYFNF